MNSSVDVLSKANQLLASNELRPKAKAFLLLKLVQIMILVSPEKARDYWERLAKIKNQLAGEDATSINDLTPIFEEEESPKKGFAAEKIGEIDALLGNENLSESQLKDALQQIEEEVKKRFLPFGKMPVWKKLVMVWKGIDRKYALQLCGKLGPYVRKPIVRRMNQEEKLSPDEWRVYSQAASQQEASKLIVEILDEPQPKLDLPHELIEPVMNVIRGKLDNAQKLQMVLDEIAKLIKLITREENKSEIFDSFKKTIKFFDSSYVLSQQWAEKFNASFNIIALGVNFQIIYMSNVNDFITAFPKHMIDFGRAGFYGLIVDKEEAKTKLDLLLQEVEKTAESEAWFLVMLVERGLCETALALANESTLANSLVPQIQRACLCRHPQFASQQIPKEAFIDDPVAEFLYQSSGNDRTAYLREMTQNGQKTVPGALWATEKPPEEEKGFWASLWASGKTLDEIVKEYLKRNPLYSSYERSTTPSKQFEEYLRFHGYGEYRCNQIDQELLKSLIIWGDDYEEEVHDLIGRMWHAIQPEEDLLKLDFLRNAIFNRCATVFAADPDALAGNFLSWLKRTLVDKSLSWQIGKTQFTLRYPEPLLSRYALQSAGAVHEVSPVRRDKLIELALTQYASDDVAGETAARLYNASKVPLDITLPWKTKTDVLTGWQMGIIKNAIPVMVQAVLLNEQTPSEVES